MIFSQDEKTINAVSKDNFMLNIFFISMII